MSSTAAPATQWSPRRVALAWAVVTFLAAAVTAPAQGIGRDEGVYLLAAESYASFWGNALARPGRALATSDGAFYVNHEHPPLTKEVYGLTHALLSNGLGVVSHLQGFRTGAFLFAALISYLLAVTGFELAGLGGALIAPALFWLVPRHFYHAHLAALDMPITALWLAVVLAYRRCLRAAAEQVGETRWVIVTGLVFGAALATKHNAWFLPPLLGLHALLLRLPPLARASPPARPRTVGLAFVAMAVVGPLLLVAIWPWLWHDLPGRVRAYWHFHLQHENYSWLYLGQLLRRPPFPVAYPFVVTAVTVPAAIAFAYAGGLVHAIARLVNALRRPRPFDSAQGRPGDATGAGPTRPISASDEVLFLLNALFPMALIAWPTVPHFGGVKHWMPAMPFLALLGARAMVAAGRLLWPSRAAVVTAGLALSALAPGLWAVVHVHPYGTAAYNELIGGAPGAASVGMERQFWGDDVVGLLSEINEHAAPYARVWWQETAYLSVQAWQRDRRVRPDLRWANSPEAADISIWQFHMEFRDKEFLTWSSFAEPARPHEPIRFPRPVTGLYLDEVPLVQVYARPGAWR